MPSIFGIDLVALLNVIVIDVVLAGDNAVIVGLAASRVAPELRKRVIFWGMAAAVGLRIVFAAIATSLLAIVGLTLAGGILLLWVCWKMYREISSGAHSAQNPGDGAAAALPTMSFGAAVTQITFADVSMSLDNVLAVAGAAKGSTEVLVIGLGVAIVLMAVAANFIAKLLGRYPWITWIGLIIIVVVAVDMIYDGSHEVACAMWQGPWCADGFMGLIKGMMRSNG